jgi:integrase
VSSLHYEFHIANVRSRVSPGSVTKELNILKHMLALAVEWDLIPINPAQGVKAPKLPAGRLRYLQPSELRALLEACPEWLRPIVCLLVVTGMRRGEVLRLRWLDVTALVGGSSYHRRRTGKAAWST